MIDKDDEYRVVMDGAVHTDEEWQEIRRQARVKLEELRQQLDEQKEFNDTLNEIEVEKILNTPRITVKESNVFKDINLSREERIKHASDILESRNDNQFLRAREILQKNMKEKGYVFNKELQELEKSETEIVNERKNPFLEAKSILQKAMKENNLTPEDVKRDLAESLKEVREIISGKLPKRSYKEMMDRVRENLEADDKP